MKPLLPISLMLVGTTTLAAMLNGVGGGSVIINGVEQSTDSDNFIEADTNALAQMTNYVSWKSNNVYMLGTTQTFDDVVASTIRLTNSSPQLRVVGTNQFGEISINLFNQSTPASAASFLLSTVPAGANWTLPVALIVSNTAHWYVQAASANRQVAHIFGRAFLGSGVSAARNTGLGGTNVFLIYSGNETDLAPVFKIMASSATSTVLSSYAEFRFRPAAMENNYISFNGGLSARRFSIIGTNNANAIDISLTNNQVNMGHITGGLYGLGNTNAAVTVGTNNLYPRNSLETAGQIKTRDAFFTAYSGIATLTSGVCIVTLPYGMTTTNYHPFCTYIGQTADLSTSLVNRAITTNNFTMAGDARGTNFHWILVGEIAR